MVTRDGKIHAKAQIERTSAPGPHCRGYARVATTATCGLLRGQYRVALVNWEGRSAKARETTLDWFVHFFGSSAVRVVRSILLWRARLIESSH